jgi:hypothetical protein
MSAKYVIECDEATYSNILKLLHQQEQNRIRARERQRRIRGCTITPQSQPAERFLNVSVSPGNTTQISHCDAGKWVHQDGFLVYAK